MSNTIISLRNWLINTNMQPEQWYQFYQVEYYWKDDLALLKNPNSYYMHRVLTDENERKFWIWEKGRGILEKGNGRIKL